MAAHLHPEAHGLWGLVLEYGKGEQYSLELVADALGVALAEAGGPGKGEVLKRVWEAAEMVRGEAAGPDPQVGGPHDRLH